MKTTLIAFLLLLSFTSISLAAEPPTLNDLDDEISYSVGHQVGRDMLRQQVKINPELVLQGILDATDGNEPMLKFEKMIDILAGLKDRIVKTAQQKNTALRYAGEVFLKNNSLKKDVVTLESGVQYKILNSGAGEIPVSGDTVELLLTGKNIEDQQFYSTTRNGETKADRYKVADVIPGLREALMRMPEGAEWEVYIPHFLAFKDTGPLAGQTVIYNLKLLKVNP